MKERPILFSGPMVRAILDGRKTQTRRLVKPQPEPVSFGWELRGKHGAFTQWGEHIKHPFCATVFCPHGQPGDRLWVKETFYESGYSFQSYPEDDEWKGWAGHGGYFFAADGIPPCRGPHDWGDDLDNENRAARGSKFFPDQGNRYWRKRPSIHMPRAASRIQLEITNVRVERLNDISEDDAKAEGADCMKQCDDRCWIVCGPLIGRCREGYRWLWESINGAGSWAANPWVWVIEFRRI